MKKKELINELTIDEKIALFGGNGPWHFRGITRLNIPDVKVSDGPHGVRVFKDTNFKDERIMEKTSLCPSLSTLSNSFNKEVAFKVGKIIGEECNHYGVRILLAPGTNLKRNPLGGRNFEYFSEDPILSGFMASNYINGVQSMGVGTSLKHFILNEQETLRRFASSEASNKIIRELYAKPFEMAIKDANPYTVMCSYNKVNGVYVSESDFVLNKLLRKDLGYSGVVISDWGSVQNKVSSFKNGLNIEMPGAGNERLIKEAYLKGEITLDLINERAKPILDLYDKVLSNKNYLKEADFNRHTEELEKIVEECVVLLKNEDDILPLKKDEKILYVGEYIKKPHNIGIGSVNLRPYYEDNLYDVLELNDDNYLTDLNNLEKVKSFDKIVIAIGSNIKEDSEGKDREHMSYSTEYIKIVQDIASINPNVILLNYSGSCMEIYELANKVKGVVNVGIPGGPSSKAIANLLFKRSNFSGRLSETWPIKHSNVLTSKVFPGREVCDYNFEKLYIGYRFFDTFDLDVAYPFGYGLSYQEVDYSNISIVKKDNKVIVSFDISNKSNEETIDVPQIYISYPKELMLEPKKVLVDFVKVRLKPLETKKLSFELDYSSFETYNEKEDKMVTYTGKYMIQIGKNVRDIVLKEEIDIETEYNTDDNIDIYYPICVYRNSPRFKEKMINFENRFRKFAWWEMEDPTIKIINRVVKEFNLSEKDKENIIKNYFN